MIYITKIVTSFILPPGIIILLLFGLCLWLMRRDRLASVILTFLTIGIYLCSTPMVGSLLIKPLENKYQPPPVLEGDVLIMLTGGATLDTPDIDGIGQLSCSSASRLSTVARLQKRTQLPIIVTGGQVNKHSGNEALIAKRCLVSLGIPEEKILTEINGLNTTQSSTRTNELLTQLGYRKPILVTSAYHMPRSVLNFSKVGVQVVPYPCDYTNNTKTSFYYTQFLPYNFQDSWLALHEYLGIIALSI